MTRHSPPEEQNKLSMYHINKLLILGLTPTSLHGPALWVEDELLQVLENGALTSYPALPCQKGSPCWEGLTGGTR